MTCFLLGSLSGCASSPIELPTCEVEQAAVDIQGVAELPDLPAPMASTGDTVTFSKEGFHKLTVYATVAGGIQDVAEANTAALETQSEAYNELIECARIVNQFGQVREEQLARERRDHFIDNWFHRGLIALGILVSL